MLVMAQFVPVAQIEIANKPYSFFDMSNPESQKLIDEYLYKKIQNVFYLHVSGIEFNHKMSKGTEKWITYRSSPSNAFDPKFKPKQWSIVLQRNTNAKHINYFRSSDIGSNVDEFVEQERINVIYSMIESNKNTKDRLKSNNGFDMTYKGNFIVIADSKDINSKNTNVPYLCIRDMGVAFAVGNLNVNFRTNYTDFNGTNMLEVCKQSIPLELAIAIQEYINRPVPTKKKIQYPETKFFAIFSTPNEVLRIGEEMKLDIAYTIEATRCPEWIRLRATEGEFRRDKNDIYYKATKLGKQTIYLEAISGTGTNGSSIYDVSFAEQRKIDIVVVTGKESNADIDRIAGYRSWTAFTRQFPVTAKFISIDNIDNIELANINKDTLKDKIVVLEKKETKEYVKVKFNDLTTNDKNYVIEQITKQK
jgi:hypothetical protein